MGVIKEVGKVLGNKTIDAIVNEIREGFSFFHKFKSKIHSMFVLIIVISVLQVFQLLALIYLIYKI